MEARAKELEFRAEVSVVVASDLSGVLGEASEAGENIEWAIRNAKGRIERVRTLESRLKVAALLISLAGALASGNVRQVLKAGKALAD